MAEIKFACRPQDDLYTAVNGEWEKTAVIPADRSSVGGFADLDIGVEKLLMHEFEAFRTGAEPTPELLTRAVALYAQAMDAERRQAEGLKPIAAGLEFISGLSGLEAVSDQAYALSIEHGFPLFFNVDVDVDAKDSDHHVLSIAGPSTILPDTTYYTDRANTHADEMLQAWSAMVRKILAHVEGLSSDRAEALIAGALAFDARIATMVKSSVEWADYIAAYNPSTVAEVAAKMPGFGFEAYLDRRFPGHGSKIIVAEPRFLDEVHNLLNDEAMNEYLAWAYIRKVLNAASYASEELRTVAGEFRRGLYGIKEAPALDKYAYHTASNIFSDIVGIYYGQTYFGAEARADITEIVKDIIATYSERIATKEWLSPDTRKKAQLKLSTMVLKLGYPDRVSPEYDTYLVDEHDCLLTTMLKIGKAARAYRDTLLFKDVDRELWVMPGHMVNACYNPTSNDLTFPAAILQAPFYSIKQSRAENLGGIGTVIGHEISHAFDNNGAQCDEKGNINNWWTEEDYKNFQAMTKAETEQFDHLPLCGSYTNGELIVSESIADNGGVGAALQAAHKEGITDLKPFFINYAKIWCMKAEDSYRLVLLKVDVHAPNYWRANMQPRNFPEWYEAFDVKETDGMYLAPEKRVSIW